MKRKYNSLKKQCKKNILNTIYKDCPYFPCHQNININDFSCFFCFCIYYENKKEGGCKNKEGQGKWHFYKKNNKEYKIWDCSDCILPHKIEYAIDILISIFNKKEK